MIKYFRLALPLSILAVTVMPQSLVLAQAEQHNDKDDGLEIPEQDNTIKNNETAQGGYNNAEMKSLLLSDNDIKSIRRARDYYEQNLNGNKGIAEDDFLKSLEKIGNMQNTDPKSFIYPQFFLSSLAYRSANDWVVWINSEKFTQASGVSPTGLRIIHIDNDKVTLEWKPDRMDKIADTDDSVKDAVKVDFINNKVTFTLKANQTFTTYSMRVVEGKLPPVSQDLDNGIAAEMIENVTPGKDK